MVLNRLKRLNNLPVGTIPVDAIFTPTRKVNYLIEPVHVGREVTLKDYILKFGRMELLKLPMP